ncbi:hypothetical protein B0H14DRAFT_3855856 [Mycena olivaceomarginata]|nr:hypothetical protein B0H14DRAFT_3855856 [Mycena olivaceomarginata]
MDSHSGSDDFQPIDETAAAGPAAVLSTAQDHRVADVRAGDKPWCPLEIDLDDSASSEGSFWDSSTDLLANRPMARYGFLDARNGACQHTVGEGPRYDTPRICHGPLAITSSLGAPCLSPELKRARTPISNVGCGGRWFAGDLGMWHQRNGHDDKAIVSSSFGRVWVGYLGEEEEAKGALRWDTLQWGVNLVQTLVLFFGYHLAVRFLFWILALGGMI